MKFSKTLRKKLRYQLVAGFVLACALMSIYVFAPNYHLSVDNRIRDFFFISRGQIPTTGNVVVIDIDERSLKELGQWPWPRKTVAKLNDNLASAGAGIIGYDVVFAEPDNSSPHKVLAEMGITDIDAPNYNEIYAKTVAQYPIINGYFFALEEDGVEPDGRAPSIPAIFIERNKPEHEFLIKAHRPVLNVPEIQDAAYSSGYFNTVPDDSGMVRSVPLLIKYDGSIYPALSFEMIRIATQARKVNIYYDDAGVRGIVSGDLEIPTDRFGRLYVNFRGGTKTFKYISAVDVINNTDAFNHDDVAGKFVLIGTSAAGLLDLRSMPFESAYPGVEIHANAIDNMLMGDFISRPAWADGAELVSIAAIIFVLSLIFTFTGATVSVLVLAVSVGGALVFFYHMLFQEGIILNVMFPISSIILTFMISIAISYLLESRQKEAIKGKFATKVSPAVMEELVKDPDSNVFAAMEKEITVFFSDVRNFTNISEAMGNPKNLIDFMNEYMDPMTDIIIESGGTIDKFIGDAIMAYWNAPSDVENHPDKAVIATLNQLHHVRILNKQMREDPRFAPVVEMADRLGKPIVDIGIGLNTGVAIVGEMGSTARADYTVIGDPINLGARLESLCKYYNSKCNLSNFTKAQLTGDYIYRFLDLVTVKGKTEPIEIWQIHDFDKGKDGIYLFEVSRERIQEELDSYHRAIDLYKAADFKQALDIFKEISAWEDKTNKNVYDMYIERCEHYIAEPPENFNGVFVHSTKG